MHSPSKVRTVTGLVVALLLATSTSACVATAHPRTGIVYVREAPPRALREVRPVAPTRGHIWIPGHYDYRARAYVWIPGRYELPMGSTYRRWEQGKWHHDRNGWYWVDGRWR